MGSGAVRRMSASNAVEIGGRRALGDGGLEARDLLIEVKEFREDRGLVREFPARVRCVAARSRESRLKGGCSQDWLPYTAASRKRVFVHARVTAASGQARRPVPLEIFAVCEQTNAQ